MAGTLFVVATPIGNLEDISARAVRVLREVALIAAEDTRRTGHLLQRFGLTTRTISFHEHSEKGKTSELIARLLGGENIALVSDAGTPTVSDPGEHLIRMAFEAGIRVEPVPGPSAVVAALSASGFGAEGFAFVGFTPRKGSERREWFERVRASAAIVPAVVFYEAPHRILSTLDELYRTFGALEVAVCRELTKAHEEIIHGRLGEIVLAEPRGEFTVALHIGQFTTLSEVVVETSPADMASEFGHITETRTMTRRQAISFLARKYGLPSREVFAMLERAKQSGV